MPSSLSVLCGQMLVVGLEGETLTNHERRLLSSGARGGVVLFRRNVGADLFDVAELARDVAASTPRDFPPLVAVDQEGGRVMRLGPPALQLPPMRRLGDLASDARAANGPPEAGHPRDARRAPDADHAPDMQPADDLLGRVALAQARELRALGFTMSFAPVADVHTRDENPIIGDRAFAREPEKVARFAAAWAAGLARGGILSCAKHFPGHGDTIVDSHLALPRVDRAAGDLDRTEIAPFRALSRPGVVDAMMTAHVVYTALDARQPATLSHAVCMHLLRTELGFAGVLFSDDLEMKALTMPVGEAAVRAIAAGCDALLVCSRADLAEEAHAALVREAEHSSAFRSRCEEARARILAMKRRSVPAPVHDRAALRAAFEASRPVAAELSERLAQPLARAPGDGR